MNHRGKRKENQDKREQMSGEADRGSVGECHQLLRSMEKKMQEEVVVLALREPGTAFSGATGLTKGLATGEVVSAAGTRPDSFPRTAGRGIPPQQRGKRLPSFFPHKPIWVQSNCLLR